MLLFFFLTDSDSHSFSRRRRGGAANSVYVHRMTARWLVGLFEASTCQLRHCSVGALAQGCFHMQLLTALSSEFQTDAGAPRCPVQPYGLPALVFLSFLSSTIFSPAHGFGGTYTFSCIGARAHGMLAAHARILFGNWTDEVMLDPHIHSSKNLQSQKKSPPVIFLMMVMGRYF